jgi:hypothetical protein
MQHDSGGNLQDAPRIKNILKAAISETEQLAPPNTPADIVALEVRPAISNVRSVGLTSPKKSGKAVTSIVNLVFVLANNTAVGLHICAFTRPQLIPLSQAVAQLHFVPGLSYDFLDLFTPVPLSSASRARAFLWLCWHYLQSFRTPNVPNPFEDAGTRGCPPLVPLNEAEAALENVDSEDERRMGAEMSEKRRLFRERGGDASAGPKGGEDDAASAVGDGASTIDDGDADTASVSVASRSASVAGDAKPRRRAAKGTGRGKGKRKAPVPDEPDVEPPLTGLEALSAEGGDGPLFALDGHVLTVVFGPGSRPSSGSRYTTCCGDTAKAKKAAQLVQRLHAGKH